MQFGVHVNKCKMEIFKYYLTFKVQIYANVKALK